jgi:DNA replication protein DnaD
MILCTWPSDTDITSTIKTSYKLASDLAKALDMNSTPNEKSLQPFILIEEQNLEVSTGIELSSDNPDEFFEIDREVSDTISQASKHTTNTIDNVFNFSNIENENINDQNYQQQIISTLNNTTRIFQQLTPHGMVL